MQPRLFQVLVISGRRFGSTGALRRNTRRDAVIGDTLRPIEGRTAMSFVIANPEMLAAAATDLAGIRSAISAATAAAAAPTIQVAAAGADEVSLAISALFWPARPGLSGAQRPGDDLSRPVRAGPDLRRQPVCGRREPHRRADGAQRDQRAHPDTVRPPADRRRRQRDRGEPGRPKRRPAVRQRRQRLYPD
ncbi:putative PE family protein, partial [Mycobacterium tuberculosis SUMu006]